MNPHDDPEERIRQLEQLRSGQGPVELGTTQPNVHVNLPPPVYSDPYSAPPFGVSYPQGPGKGAPVGLVLAVIAVAVVVVTGVIGVVVWNMASQTPTVTLDPGVAGGGALDPGVEMPDIDMPVVEPMLPGRDSVVTAPPGGRLSVAGIDGTKTVECDDSDVNVSGVNNTVTITGHCASVTVSGVDNQVTLDSADDITASGFDNRVIYHFGEPEINATERNVIEQG